MRSTASIPGGDWKTFLKLLCTVGLPVTVQSLVGSSASMIDTVMLGTLGETVVGSIGLCGQFSHLIWSVYSGFIVAGTLFIAQYWGAKDDSRICSSYGLMLVIVMAIGALAGVLCFCSPYTIMALYTDKSVFWDTGARYLRYLAFALPLQILAACMSSMLRATERVRIPFVASMFSLATNVLGNYLLIFGKLGLPRLGVDGAAIATVLSALVNIAVMVFLAAKQKHPYLLRFSAHFRWEGAFVRQYLAKTFPVLCNNLIMGIARMGINVIMGRQAAEAIAALAVFRTFEGFVGSFNAGFNNSSSILVGKEVGAGRHELALRRSKQMVITVPIVIGVCCGVFLLFHRQFLTAMSLTGETFAIGRSLLFSYALIALMRMPNWCMNDTFRSAGDAVFGTVMEIAFMYAIVLPCMYLTGIHFECAFLLVFLSAYVDEPLRLIVMLRHNWSGKWIRPVTAEGNATLAAFREKLGIK
ncbi:MAG: MATE family efflux transporter [Eubacteriales bacterium]|nr:MATE family efflux transporter [Eubacteriales bacterium]